MTDPEPVHCRGAQGWAQNPRPQCGSNGNPDAEPLPSIQAVADRDLQAPAGSSSGSAAGLAAGFAPLALATETDGSMVQPASRAALYGLKATVGLLSTEETTPWSSLTDSIGGMANSPQDLAALFEVLNGATECRGIGPG